VDGLDETVDPPYLVPTHLGEGQSIGPIPVRTFYVVLASALLLGAPVATLGRRVLVVDDSRAPVPTDYRAQLDELLPAWLEEPAVL